MTKKPWSVLITIQMPSKIIELEIKYQTEAECLTWIGQAPVHPNLTYSWGCNASVNPKG